MKIGACVASTVGKMKWNAQDKSMTCPMMILWVTGPHPTHRRCPTWRIPPTWLLPFSISFPFFFHFLLHLPPPFPLLHGRRGAPAAEGEGRRGAAGMAGFVPTGKRCDGEARHRWEFSARWAHGGGGPARWLVVQVGGVFFAKLFTIFFVFFCFGWKNSVPELFFLFRMQKILSEFFYFECKSFFVNFFKVCFFKFFLPKTFLVNFFYLSIFLLETFSRKNFIRQKNTKKGKKCQKINSMNLILRSPVN